MGIAKETDDLSALSKAIPTLVERCRTLLELSNALRYYILEYVDIDPKAGEKFLNQGTLPLLKEVIDGIEGLTVFDKTEIERLFVTITERHGVKLGQLAQPVRVALTGGTVSPGIFDVIEIVGKEKTLKRLRKAIESI